MAPSNVLPIHGNEKTMNLNTLVLTNIQSSPYFKVHLYELKTYHQVIDEIYYKVNHLEPWEKGSRKTAGQTGMCGGVRGVGAGGIVSSAYCLLFKLYTLKLTRKQLIGLCTHADSPYIRALGLMYIRYTQPPGDLWDWYEPYLDDEEQVDVKAGGGNMMTIGEISQQYLTKLEWYSTLFPRIPVPIQKQIEAHLNGHRAKNWNKAPPQHVDAEPEKPEPRNDGDNLFGEAERVARRETSRERRPVAPSSRRPDPHERDRLDQERSRPREDRHSYGDVKRDSHGDVKRDSHRRSRSPRGRRSVSRDRHQSRSGDHIRRSHDRSRHRSRDRSPGRSSHHRRSKDRKRSSSRSRRRSRSHDDKKRSDDGARHSSKTIDGAKRHCSSRHRSASPNHHHASSAGDAFDRDLQKELERVKAAVKDTENGRK